MSTRPRADAAPDVVRLPDDPVELALREAIFAALRRARATSPGADPSYGRWPIPRYDGGPDRNGRRFRPLWPQFVGLLRRHPGVPPRAFAEALVAAAYQADAGRGAALRPDHLLKQPTLRELPGALKAWVRDPVISARQAVADFRDAVAVLVRCRGLSPAAAANAALVDPSQSWDELERCCLAYSVGAIRVAEALTLAARALYLADPTSARQAWGPMLPPFVSAPSPRG